MSRKDDMLLHHLAQFISDHKRAGVDSVLDRRTRHVTVVLENIYQSQNASAAIRTCECMGLQDVHIVENTAKYELNIRVLKGSNKWMNLMRYREKNTNNTESCFAALRSQGYRILVADPSADGVPIGEVDVTAGKIAILFGNELHGASEYSLAQADGKVRIPMFGFTESLNISASVAICLNTVLTPLRLANADIHLSPSEKDELRLAWYRKIVKRSDILEREFLRTIE